MKKTILLTTESYKAKVIDKVFAVNTQDILGLYIKEVTNEDADPYFTIEVHAKDGNNQLGPFRDETQTIDLCHELISFLDNSNDGSIFVIDAET